MSELIQVYSFVCPYCWETNEAFADLTADQQSYIEDCQVCCHPVQISFSVIDSQIADLLAEKSM